MTKRAGVNFLAMIEGLQSHPQRTVALYAEGAVVRKTFPEVDRDVRETVRRLSSWGIEPGMRVGLYGANSYQWVVHDLALITLRVTSVALPDGQNPEQLDETVRRYSLNLVLASKQELPPYRRRRYPVAYLDDASTLVKPAPRQPEAVNGYLPSIIFSSGSTGRLKSLKTSETGTMEVISYFYRQYAFDEDDLFLVFLPLSSYQQRLMVYGCIRFGVDFAIVRTNELFQALKDFRPTLCSAPPMLYETVHRQVEEKVRALPAPKRWIFGAARRAARLPVFGPLRRRLRKICFEGVHDVFGGRMRILWTGMAPIRRSTLDFFDEAQVPLFETYGLNESGPITTNSPREKRLGSVGRPIVEDSVRIAPDGEIIVERDAFMTTGYQECEPGDEASTYLSPTRIATGDIGYLDADGFLYLKGRKKEIIVTKEGFKIHPELVEGQLNRYPEIMSSAAFGGEESYLEAVVVLDEADLPTAARIAAMVEEVNRNLPHAVRIGKYCTTSDPFTMENGFLTPNLKLNRRKIFEHFQKQMAAGS